MAGNAVQQNALDAIALIGRVPGYEGMAQELSALLAAGRVRFAETMHDRGRASLTGTITLGGEALAGSVLGLAETLIHENYHRHQNHFLKTASFWAGVGTGTHPMGRYERPAYAATLRFLQAVEAHLPEWADEARREQAAILAAFSRHYGGTLAANEP